jgi:hypothetical protein
LLQFLWTLFLAFFCNGLFAKEEETISCLYIYTEHCQKTDSVFFLNDLTFPLMSGCSCWQLFLLSPVQAGNIGIYDVTEEQDE